ncbi:MAG: SAM-dependent methyltransferase [Acidimicrobiia bacterium]
MGGSVVESLTARIRRDGPIAFSEFMEAALYGPGGFFSRGQGPGRSDGDFLTSPQTGSLFGILVARALDMWWSGMGEPDPFFLVEAGAGDGRLARDVLRAEPACGPALRYVLVEVSEAARAAQAGALRIEPAGDVLGSQVVDEWDTPEPAPRQGPILTSLPDLPAGPLTGVVLANELLDNIPVDIVERTDSGWQEVRVGAVAEGTLVEVPVAAAPDLARAADAVLAGESAPAGSRLPVPRAAATWLAEATHVLDRGIVALLDYAVPVRELLERGPDGWLRTYRSHQRAAAPLKSPGTTDITVDLPLEYLRESIESSGMSVVTATTQTDWLTALGLPDLVADGEQIWAEGAHRGDLEALAGRSRATEAAALTADPGLGAHTVLVATTPGAFGRAARSG